MSRVPERHYARSHEALLTAMASTARATFARGAPSTIGGPALPGWNPSRRTGHAEVDLGRGLLDSVALALHVLWTYQQAWAEEGFLATARLPSSIDNLLASVGYHPRPGTAATGYQHLRARAGAPGAIPAGFALSSAARGDELDAIYETLEPLRVEPLLNEVRAFLPPALPTTPRPRPGKGSDFGSGNGEPTVPAGGLFGNGSVLGALQDRLDAARSGALEARRRARAKQKARDLARMINLMDASSSAACKAAMGGLCEKLCDAQQIAAGAGGAADRPVGSMSETQEMLGRQLRNLSRRQQDAIAALEAAMKRCADETPAQYAARLDKLAEFLDAFVGSMVQEARDQLVLLRGVDVLSRLDAAFGGGALERGLAAPGTDALYLPRVEGTDGALIDLPVRPGAWLALGVDVERVDAGGKIITTRTFHEVVRVVRVAREVPRGEKRAMLKIQFVPPLAGRYPLDRTVLLGNLVPISHGKSVVEQLIAAGDRRTVPLGQAPLTWLRDPNRPRGRDAPVTVTVGARAWRQVDDLLDAGPDEPVFAVEPAPGGGHRLRFGDGVNGAPLPGDGKLVARYRVGVGVAGNRAARRIEGLATSHPAVESTFNPLPTSGGADPDRASRSRSLGPMAVGAIDRAVSIGDVVALALNYDGVMRARVLRDPRWPRQLSVIVAGVGGRAFAAGELDALATYLRARVAPGISIAVANRVLIAVKLAILIRYRRGADPISLVSAVRARLGVDELGGGGLLDPDRVELGDDLPLSAIYDALDRLPGLHSAVVKRLYRSDDPPALHQQVRAGGKDLLTWAGGDGVAIAYEEGVDR